MAANAGPQEDASSEADRAEGPSAVATMTRLIHDLYAANGSYAAVRGGRDSDLISWTEMLAAVQRCESPSGAKLPGDN